MKRALCFAGSLLAIATLVVHASGCSEETPAPLNGSPADGGDDLDGGGAVAPLADPAVPCGDAVDAVYGDPGAVPTDDASRGKILKCSKDADLAKDALQAELTRLGYTGKPVASGARTFKVLYRTTRGDAASTPGYSSAIVYVPTTQRADKLPIVVAARGSRGQAARCAVSKFDPALGGINDDAHRLAYTLVGNGYAVIVPDLAGYANFGAANNPPSAYAQAADVGRSTLDGSRALKQLFPQLDDKTILVGHSQGGHSALSALALADSYGAQGTIAGVAVYAPLWLSQRTWGSVLEAGIANDRDYTIAKLASPSAIAVWYHYTQAELLDGPGEGIKLFKADKQAAVKEFVDGACWGEYKLLSDNAKFAYELFVDGFPAAIGNPAAGLSQCNGDATCDKWISRYKADRPNLTGAAATTPILMMYGGADTTITPDRMACALDRLKSDGTNLTVCYEGTADHASIIDVRGEHVADWIASLTLGATAPAACAANESAITATCATPPPND
ncbi:MAG: alpha/beta fold hydrolase [Labilithrix sp.]|nr:alpha/beta fold hydrolase [Labilithrix sp.]